MATSKPPPDDDALWQAVTRDIRPLTGRVPAPLPDRRRIAVQVRAPAIALPASRPSDRLRPEAAALDGSWDRRIRSGRLDPEVTIDLHGFSLAHAHSVLATAVRRAFAHHNRVLLVITGKGGNDGRGAIRAALPLWLETPELRGFVAALRSAHPRHGGNGAWYIVLRRQRGAAD
jgi:DNA-nicking Smr family endonuclease